MKIKECINELNLYSDRVGIRILPCERAKYMRGENMLSASADYGECEIQCAYGKNDAIVFVVTKAEALKHNLIQEVEYE